MIGTPKMGFYGMYELMKPEIEAVNYLPVNAQQVKKSIDLYLKTQKIWENNNELSDKDRYREFVVDVMTIAKKLLEASEDFKKSNYPILQSKSSDNIKCEITPSASLKNYMIDVKQLAEKHSYISNALSMKDLYFKGGMYALQLSNNKKQEKIVFEIAEKDSTVNTLSKIVSTINSSSQIASSRMTRKNDFLYLEIQAKKDGVNSIFMLEDDFGKSLKILGVSVHQKGQDSEIILDGTGYIINNNKLKLDENLTIHWTNVGKSLISIEINLEDSFKLLQKVVNYYNELRNIFVKDDKENYQYNDLFSIIDICFDGNNNALYGFKKETTGIIALDEKTFLQQLQEEPDKIKKFLDDVLVKELYDVANAMQFSPIVNYFSSLDDLTKEYFSENISGMFFQNLT